MNPLLTQFVDESEELLDRCNDVLLRLEKDPQDEDSVEELFRAVHTLKGNSGLFDFPELSELLHATEDVMEALRSARLVYQPGLSDLLFRLLDAVRQGLADIRAEGKPTTVILQHQDLMVNLKGWMDDQAPLSASPSLPTHERGDAPLLAMPLAAQVALWPAFETADVLWHVAYRPAPDAFYHGDDPLWQARHAPGLVWGTIVSPQEWPDPEILDLYQCVLAFHMISQAPQSEIVQYFQFDAEAVTLSPVDRWQLANLGGRDALRGLDENRRSALFSLLRHEDFAALIEFSDGASTASVPEKWFRGFVHAGKGDKDRVWATLREWAAHFSGQVLAATNGLPDIEPTREETARQGIKQGRDDENVRKMATIRVASEKIDRLMALVGEMVVAKNGLPYLAKKAESEYGVNNLAREMWAQYAAINRIADDLQAAVFDVRMVPMATIFQRFPKLVRDLARKLGKDVALSIVGEDTEIDKGVAEILAEPLLHLIRNSLDHGIELPDERRRLGKALPARLRLSAWYQGDQVVVEVSDDGRGLDSDRIRRRAHEKGLVAADELQRLSDQDVWGFIFHPGFSTATSVSDVSGRGVGMDIVKQVVEQRGGRIVLESHQNQGLSVRLIMPLAMMSRRVMVVELGRQSFGIPIEDVVETVRVAPDRLQHLGHRPTLTLRGHTLSLVNLAQVLAFHEEPRPNQLGEWAVLIGRVGDEDVGFIIDDFRETVDVIVKPLGEPLAYLSVYQGTALLGDGSVLLVLNLKELIRWQWS